MHAAPRAAKEAFEQWRTALTGRQRIPEGLWQTATALSESYSLCKIAAELRIDYHRLRQCVRERLPQSPPSQLIEVRMVSTNIFTERFFAHRKGGQDRLESLTVARSDLRRAGYEHPLFWLRSSWSEEGR